MPTQSERTSKMYLPVEFERGIVTWQDLFVCCLFSFSLYDVRWWKKALKWTKQLLFPFKSHTHKTSRSFYMFTKGGNRSNINTKHWLPLDLSLNSSPRFSYTYMRKYLWISIWDLCKIPASLRKFFLFKKQLSDRNNISQASVVFMEHWLTVVAFVYFSWYDIKLGYSSALFCFFFLSDPECWWRIDLAAWKIS